MSTEPVLRLKDVVFGWDPQSTLINISEFEIARGESVFLRGASGSGKSTLLSLIGGVMTPRSGDVAVMGQDITQASSARRDQIRADHIGIIFQQFNLLPYLSVLENITLPGRFSKKRREASKDSAGAPIAEARALVEQLGLPEDLLSRPVSQLSVGQQQRVATARALIGKPDLIIADEPTSALDTDNRDRFISLLDEQRKRSEASLLFVSHDGYLAKHFDRVVEIEALNRSDIGAGAA
ncbi:MAG: ABC transporter ATP-binding protein [Pseudomonadota bacterium]